VGPDRSQATELLRRLLKRWKQSPSQAVVDATTGLSYADIRAAVDDAQKASVLDGRGGPDPDEVLVALRARAERLR
jgi:non-ribosomal peptide synthetase component E (peptide arylation enzyme)